MIIALPHHSSIPFFSVWVRVATGQILGRYGHTVHIAVAPRLRVFGTMSPLLRLWRSQRLRFGLKVTVEYIIICSSYCYISTCDFIKFLRFETFHFQAIEGRKTNQTNIQNTNFRCTANWQLNLYGCLCIVLLTSYLFDMSIRPIDWEQIQVSS